MLIRYDFFYDLDKINEELGFEFPTTVKELCYEYTNGGTGLTLESIVHQSAPYVFSFDYPIHDENHRLALEEKIIKRYFYRRICCSDVDEWKLRLDARMNEIMPYYNKIYESFDYLKDILDDVDYTREIGQETQTAKSENSNSTTSSIGSVDTAGSRTDNTDTSTERTGSIERVDNGMSSSNGSQNTSSDALSKYADTPQGTLSGLRNDSYLTNATMTEASEDKTMQSQGSSSNQTKEDNSNTETGSVDRKTDTIGTTNSENEISANAQTEGIGNENLNREEKVKGKMYGGSKSKYVMEYRQAIINVDMEIIGRLADLFLNVY